MNFSVVVLPEPDVPTKATKAEASICSVTRSTANVRPPSKLLETLSISTKAAMASLTRGIPSHKCTKGGIGAVGGCDCTGAAQPIPPRPVIADRVDGRGGIQYERGHSRFPASAGFLKERHKP